VVRRTGIFFAGRHLENAAETTCATLRKSFIGIEPFMMPLLKVPESAFDNCARHYDVQALLACLTIPENMDMVLWIVDKKIGSFWQPNLFGAAWEGRAVVSEGTLGREDLMARVACHETGHLLGLGHCRAHCCMQHSPTVALVEMKPDILCEKCFKKLPYQKKA
jgi:predicted Zn-dependent protease